MKTLRRLIAVVLLALLGIALFQNQESLGLAVEFAFLRWRFSLVLGFWLLLAFVAGALLFAVLDAWRGFRRGLEERRRGRETDARVEALRAEIERLKGREQGPGNGQDGSAFPR